MKKTRVSLSLLCGLTWLLVGNTPLLAIEEDKFPLNSFMNFQRPLELPGAVDNIFDAVMPRLSLVVRNSGDVRRIPSEKAIFLESVFKAVGRPQFSKPYKREVRVVEQGQSYWLPVQEAVVPHLLEGIPPGKEFTVYARFLGGTKRLGWVFIVIDFDSEVRNRLPRTNCFAKELAGVRIGEPIQTVQERLTKRYGQPFKEGLHGGSRFWAYGLDPKFRTQLIIADAGGPYRKNVFSVQITGPPNPNLILYKALRLGDPPSAIEPILGKPTKAEDSGEGYTLQSYENSQCSVEMKHGVLASMRVSDDPNYFSE